MTDTKKLQLNYWQAFNDYAFSKPEFSKLFSRHKPYPQHWYTISVGISVYHIDLSANTQKNRIGAEIYISDNMELFETFKASKCEIESELGVELVWRTATKDNRILALHGGNIKQGEEVW